MDFINRYFAAERSESMLFMAVGVVSILISFFFWFGLKQAFHNGMAWPLFLVGLIQLTVGYIVFVRTPGDVERVNKVVSHEPGRLQQEEIPRMEQVMQNFVIYRWVEMGLAIIGLALFLYFGQGSYWKGVGAGLFLQASLMLFLDLFAERRGQEYLEALRDLIGK